MRMRHRGAVRRERVGDAAGQRVPGEGGVPVQFGQFVEWPSQSYSSPNAPFVIGVVGKDPFGKTLDDVVRGESLGGTAVHGAPLQGHRRHRGLQHPVHRTQRDGAPGPGLGAARGRNVLTVTDIEGAERRGAIIVLVNEENRMRMRINLSAARASELVISSKLLRPAEW